MPLAILFFVVCSLVAQTAPPPPTGQVSPVFKLGKRKPNPSDFPIPVKEQIAFFFQTMMKDRKNIHQAYEHLLRNSRLSERKENVDNFTEKTASVIDLFGDMIDYEHYDTQKVGRRMIVLSYISWHKLYPVQWRMTYYLSDKDWTLIDLIFSTQVEDLIE